MKTTLLKWFITPKLIGNFIRGIAAFLSALVLQWLLTAPGWAQNVIQLLAENLHITVDEAGLTGFFTVLIVLVLEYIASKTNGVWVSKIQDTVNTTKDAWAYKETYQAVDSYVERFNTAMDEISELKDKIFELETQKKLENK